MALDGFCRFPRIISRREHVTWERAVEDASVTKLGKVLRSGHVQVAAATGLCIVVMAYVSKRIMHEAIPDLYLAVPPFLMTLYEGFRKKGRGAEEGKVGYWVAAIFLATICVLWLNW
jgi:hypothetical protein